MNTINEQLTLIDWMPSKEQVSFELDCDRSFILDPESMEFKNRWSEVDGDVEVLNSLYGKIFDEVVINRKRMICFWPNFEFSASEKYELTKALDKSDISLAYYKKDQRPIYGDMDYTIQKNWKEFVLFIVQSIFEDLRLNEGLQEIMSLKNSTSEITVMKLMGRGEESYICFMDGMTDLLSTDEDQPLQFTSFNELLDELHFSLNISSFAYSFNDKSYEKRFYNHHLMYKVNTNLIGEWQSAINFN